jgi:solute carrier family 10 (sodium/bile acid cotransporter), member 7
MDDDIETQQRNDDSEGNDGAQQEPVPEEAAKNVADTISQETTNTTTTTTTPENNNDNNNNKEEEEKKKKSIWQRLCGLYQQQEFLILILVAIGLARAYPKLGAVYLQPDITATWMAVILIFLLSGISLRTSELFGTVWYHWKFHILVQLVSLGLVPALVFGISRVLANHVISQELADGMVVCACLPMTINMVIVLTKAAGGDEASALVGAVLGNGVGVVLSPLLILGYLGVQGNVQVATVFRNLALRVFVPVVVGQVVQKTTTIYERVYQPYKTTFTRLQIWILCTLRDTPNSKRLAMLSTNGVGSHWARLHTYFFSQALLSIRCFVKHFDKNNAHEYRIFF